MSSWYRFAWLRRFRGLRRCGRLGVCVCYDRFAKDMVSDTVDAYINAAASGFQCCHTVIINFAAVRSCNAGRCICRENRTVARNECCVGVRIFQCDFKCISLSHFFGKRFCCVADKGLTGRHVFDLCLKNAVVVQIQTAGLSRASGTGNFISGCISRPVIGLYDTCLCTFTVTGNKINGLCAVNIKENGMSFYQID